VSASACACSRVAPGLSRPKTTDNRRACRFSMVCGLERNGQLTVGMYTSLSDGYSGIGGSTPMTVCGRLFMRKTRPTIAGSPPWLRCQYLWLSMSTASPPGVSSSGLKERPSRGFTPSTSKKLAETTPVWTRSGSSRP
jgi:hypothetical protein